MSELLKMSKTISEGLKALNSLALAKAKQRCPNVPYLTVKAYKDTTTNELTRAVIDWINLNGYQAERINSTGRQIKANGVEKWIKGSSTRGTADISSTLKGGRAVKIEIKCAATGDRYQSDDQRKYQASIEAAGGIYIVVRDFEQFYQWYNQFMVHGK